MNNQSVLTYVGDQPHPFPRADHIDSPYKPSAAEQRTICDKCEKIQLPKIRNAAPDKLKAMLTSGFDAIIPCETVEDVIDKLERNEYDEAVSAVAYNDMDVSIKKNADEMLSLITRDAMAYNYKDKSIASQEFTIKAILVNPDVYGHLTDEEKKDPQNVRAYALSIVQNMGRAEEGNRYLAINDEEISEMVAAYALYPGCPKSEFYNESNFQMIMEQGIKTWQTLDSGSADFHDQCRYIGAAASYIAMAYHSYPNKVEEYQKVAQDVIKNNLDDVKKTIALEFNVTRDNRSPLEAFTREMCPELEIPHAQILFWEAQLANDNTLTRKDFWESEAAWYYDTKDMIDADLSITSDVIDKMKMMDDFLKDHPEIKEKFEEYDKTERNQEAEIGFER